MTVSRRKLELLIIVDAPAALCLVLSAVVGMGSNAGIGLVVAAGVLILFGWTLTLGGRYPSNTGTHQNPSRRGVSVINRE
jgi:hypothetical protein